MASRHAIPWCGLIIVAFSILITETFAANVEPCPIGWVIYENEIPNTCLYVSDSTTNTLMKAHQKCVEKNASLIVIQSEKKMQFFKAVVKQFLPTNAQIWIGLQRSYEQQVTWLTKDGKIPAKSLPIVTQHSWSYRNRYYYGEHGLHYKSSSLYNYDDVYDQNSRFICEKRSTCSKGWYGLGCDKPCHCYGEKCDPTALEMTCKYGCQVGWMGPGCTQSKQDADVRYFCVDSHDQGKYVHIRIDTKGINYENIHALDKGNHTVSWCNNTIIHSDKRLSTVTINIYTDNSTDEAINAGHCAGKIKKNGNYEWQLKIQEKEGIVSRNDQEVQIECDFSDADTFQLSGDTDIKHEKWFKSSNVKKPMHVLKEKKEKVELLVVDPSTGRELSETHIGGPVALKINFALGEDSVVTGVRPYNCDASAPGGEQKTRFLDDKSCPMDGFPISNFSRNGTTNSLVTRPFPLFGFDGTEEVDFHCFYILCFGDDPCLTNECDEALDSQQQNVTTVRHRRCATAKPQRIRGTVRVINEKM